MFELLANEFVLEFEKTITAAELEQDIQKIVRKESQVLSVMLHYPDWKLAYSGQISVADIGIFCEYVVKVVKNYFEGAKN